jgi:hypothetical protein
VSGSTKSADVKAAVALDGQARRPGTVPGMPDGMAADRRKAYDLSQGRMINLLWR